MILLRLSGHSGADKTRLVNALPQFGISIPKVIRFTSRLPRPEEIEGEDYFFRSRDYISSLPSEQFLVGPVRNMLQAFDLQQIQSDLNHHDLVLIEIYPDLWPKLTASLSKRMARLPKTVSIFMTAVDPKDILSLPDEESRAGFISQEVKKNLLWRNKDSLDDIEIRARAAAREVLDAFSEKGRMEYDRIIHSAPEGPDGEDEWTKKARPVGQAEKAIAEFTELLQQQPGLWHISSSIPG